MPRGQSDKECPEVMLTKLTKVIQLCATLQRHHIKTAG